MPLFADIVVIANRNFPDIDQKTIGKIFTGKVVSINSISFVPVHLKQEIVKQKFLQKFVGMQEDEYIAYWTVRQYIGKGTPPKEFTSSSAIVLYVQQTPGAIGYINERDLVEGLKVITKY